LSTSEAASLKLGLSLFGSTASLTILKIRVVIESAVKGFLPVKIS
jgi:hypothetical protein